EFDSDEFLKPIWKLLRFADAKSLYEILSLLINLLNEYGSTAAESVSELVPELWEVSENIRNAGEGRDLYSKFFDVLYHEQSISTCGSSEEVTAVVNKVSKIILSHYVIVTNAM